MSDWAEDAVPAWGQWLLDELVATQERVTDLEDNLGNWLSTMHKGIVERDKRVAALEQILKNHRASIAVLERQLKHAMRYIEDENPILYEELTAEPEPYPQEDE